MKNLDLNQFLDKDIDISRYFSQHELNDIGIHQQTRLKNIAQNYEIMLYMGLPAIKPDFMKGCSNRAKESKKRNQVSHTTTLPTKNKITCSDSDSDETWTPDLERKKRAKGIL
ncbi:histone-lysine N-methyltransferase PRDM9-like [Ruditapes philippinarum]|uniref:histone-lysine N-methyltransferase PRDM9-like n=1 Tax=Ruditapes philippinarum TaxID=129788 RepID=UPI00295C0D0C|nr:histone-lysine N-methyltransferase PRDM9-like [Ruditapes philippinarum]